MKKLIIASALFSLITLPALPAFALTRWYCNHTDRSICADTAIATDAGTFYINNDGTISSLILYQNCHNIGGYYDEIAKTPICRAKSDNGRDIIIFKGI